jgi:hypothetical protein
LPTIKKLKSGQDKKGKKKTKPPFQGCQMVCFQTKNINLGKFWRVLQWKMLGIFYGHLVHFTVFCYILLAFGIVCGNLIHFSHFGILYEEKSGNPAPFFCFFFEFNFGWSLRRRPKARLVDFEKRVLSISKSAVGRLLKVLLVDGEKRV